jgi:hypothetical protein
MNRLAKGKMQRETELSSAAPQACLLNHECVLIAGKAKNVDLVICPDSFLLYPQNTYPNAGRFDPDNGRRAIGFLKLKGQP